MIFLNNNTSMGKNVKFWIKDKLYNYKIINDSIINIDLPVLNSNDSLFIYNFRQSQTDTILYITPVNNRKMSYVLYKVKF